MKTKHKHDYDNYGKCVDCGKWKDIDIEVMDDDKLVEKHEELVAFLVEGTNGAIDKQLNQLLEIERELTLREDK